MVYNWISRAFPWAGAREYSTLANIPQYVLDNGHGDCGQVGLLYITLVRSLGIPARWESGWVINPGDEGWHDWAETYYEGVGWVPTDPSFGRGTMDTPLENYYTTGIDGARQAAIDVPVVDEVISYLRGHGFTMVARIRTFQDTHFAEGHINCALRKSGGSLWVGDGFYWMDPANSTVMAYLKQIIRELAEKGFKEIVLDDFRFPSGTQIVYNSEKSRTELIAGVAEELLNFFASSNVTISFGNPASDFALTGDSHVYVSGVTGSGVSATVKGYTLLDQIETQLVFLTGSKDRRFDDYQVLRPLLSGGN